ncbi:hypothetical protein C810_03850 [Lachnospiraceae bacterium A2]|nr:hypothetical protein C810_03850 [Lachnospiraceae bacterium A2]
MKRNTTKKHWLKGLAMAVALVMAVSASVPTPVHAAGKMTLKVESPKKGVKLSGSKLKLHVKKSTQLQVRYNGKAVTTKAKYKSSNPKVVSVNRNGRLAVKKNGMATLTVKYKGMSKKLKVTVGGHNWKAHKKTKTVVYTRLRCNCGADLCTMSEDEMDEHMINHILNGEMTNCWPEDYEEKVTYTDYYYCECGAKKAGEPEPRGCNE